MRAFEFLIHILQAHGHCLQRLAALLGEDALLEALEIVGEKQDEAKAVTLPLRESPDRSALMPYPALQSSVSDLKLTAVLEFYLWTYPYYRRIIESDIDLNACIFLEEGENDQFAYDFIEGAVSEARNWVRLLPLPPELSKQAEAVAAVPWRRFRAEVLKKLGKRALARIN